MDEVRALGEAVMGDLALPAVLDRFRAALPRLIDVPAVGHPNGFVAMPLIEDVGVEVRLHMWTGAELAQEEHSIHDHVYDLRSLVLVGGLHQTRWRVDFDEEGALDEFAVTYGEVGSSLEATGHKVRVDVTETRDLVAGERYGVRAGEFHSISATALPTATLFAKIPVAHEALGRVIGRSLPSGRLRSERPYLSPEQNEVCLNRFAEFIG